MVAYCISVHNTTGETPAMMMMMGCDLRLPVDLFIGRPEDEPPVQNLTMHKPAQPIGKGA